MAATVSRSGLSGPSARFQPTKKSGLHFCFTAADAAAVDAFHAAAIAAGGSDHGAPGLRPIYAPDYYAAFIIDPDGYRIEAYYGPVET